jgi:hypothetical protein
MRLCVNHVTAKARVQKEHFYRGCGGRPLSLSRPARCDGIEDVNC